SCISPTPSQHLGRERDDLEKLFRAQLAGHRAKDAGADRFVILVEQHRRVAVKADVTAVVAADFLGGSDNDGARDVALFDLGVGNRLFDGDHDHVADRGVSALGAAEHLDAHHFAGARVIGDIQNRLYLYHRALPRGLFENAADAPALVLGERTRLDNLHAIAFLALAAFVVRHEAGAAAHALAVEGVLDHAVDPDHDSFSHL